MSQVRIFALLSLLPLGPTLAFAAEPDAIAADEQVLKAAKLGTDGTALLDLLCKRTITDASRAKLQALVRQLGNDEFQQREKASAELVAWGPSAAPFLRQALANEDQEIRRRARECLRRIEDKEARAALLPAAVRLLAVRRPPGAAAAILAYLPQSDDESLTAELHAALTAVAIQEGKPEPAVVEALADKAPARRIGAAVALAKLPEQRPAVRKLLRDENATVRLYAALALFEAREKESVPVLVSLLADLPVEQGRRAEEALLHVAGEKAPAVSLGKDESERQKCRDAWAAWWKANEAKIDLARLGQLRASLGLLLAVVADNSGYCKLIEYGPGGKERWHIPRLNNSVDVHALPGNRVLVAEYGSNRVAEFNFKGQVLWEAKVGAAIACQRLPNGNTFIATSGRVVEVDRQGKEVLSINIHCRAAWCYPNGQISVMGTDQRWRRYDAKGRELSSLQMRFLRDNTIGGVEFLPGNRVLIADGNTLKEYDANGKKLWEAAVQDPDCTQRLPNGNTLVACMGTGRIVELDRSGKVVWEKKIAGRPWLARRR